MNIKTENVLIPATTANSVGYFAAPAQGDHLPGLVIIHEAFGLNDNIKQITNRFAQAGYATLAVDLFGGRNKVLCMFRFFANMMLLDSLDHEGIRDLKASLTWLEDHPRVDTGRLGAVGFCMGGNFAICWACGDPRLRVVAPFYGMNPRPLQALERACPVVASYPENDFSKGAGQKLDSELDQYRIPHDVKIYPDTRHSFFNNPRDASEQSAANDAWTRMMSFFDEHMR